MAIFNYGLLAEMVKNGDLMVAPALSEGVYHKGDYVTYGGKLYRANGTAIVTGSDDFDADVWEETTVSDGLGGGSEDYSELVEAVDDINNELTQLKDALSEYVGVPQSERRTINNTASYIGANDSKTLFSAESGDEIKINITGTAFTQTVYTAYVYYEDNSNTGVAVGNGTVGIDKTVTLTKNIVGVGIYATNLTEGTIIVACQNISEKGLTKRISDLEQATNELDVDVDNLTENLNNTDEKVNAFISVVKSKNLYKGVPLEGYRSNLTVVENTTYGHTPPILLKNGSYLFTSTVPAMGSEGGKAFICDQNGTASSFIVGTLVGNKTQAGVYNNRPILQFTLQEDSYVSFNIGAINGSSTAIYSGNFMAVNGSTIDDFPDYEAYFEPYAEMNNDVPLSSKMTEQVNGLSGLIGKTAVFDGDSICKGTINGTTPKETNGWAGYVGEANAMNWHNFGISGGVITSATNPSVSGHHSVVDTVDTMYAQYPNADYVIFEGGTNDADLIGNAIADQTILGTYTSMDFTGPFDATTFTGALETIFSKATSYWKGKSIGYIVAQKMGYSTTGFDKDHTNRRAYFERAIEICNKWGIPYINLWDECYLNPNNPACYDRTKTKDENISGGYMYTDGQHLTEKGYEYISPMIEAWMKTL